MNNESVRQLTLYHQRGTIDSPSLIIQGQWFKQLGFSVGDLVSITCDDGQLIIKKIGTWKDKKKDEFVTVQIRQSELEKYNLKIKK